MFWKQFICVIQMQGSIWFKNSKFELDRCEQFRLTFCLYTYYCYVCMCRSLFHFEKVYVTHINERSYVDTRTLLFRQ